MNFTTAANRVLGHEGGYVNHPSDPGGETNWGITKAVARENGYAGSMKTMSRDVAVGIYKRAYWDAVKGDQLPFPIAFQTFDAAVNHGRGNASRWLQRALGVADDGKIGPLTIDAARKADQGDLVLRFNAIRIRFYTSLSNFTVFGRGWMNRTAGNLDYAVGDTT